MTAARCLAAALAAATIGSVCPVHSAEVPAKPAAAPPAAARVVKPGESLLSGWERPVLTVLRSPAVLLMNPAEFLEFERLDGAARRGFLDRFWASVAPNCPAGTNPVKDRLNALVSEANAKFADEGVPGWVTDRGRLYVLSGPPQKIDVAGDVQTWTFPPADGRTRTARFVKQRLSWRFAGLDGEGAVSGPVPFDQARMTLVAAMRGRGCELTAEQKAGLQLDAWRTRLFEVTGAVLAGEKSEKPNTVDPLFHYFPAENDSTFISVTVPLTRPIGADEKLVGTLRPEGSEETAYVLGTEQVPFGVRPLGTGAVAQAVRAVPPGRYALALALLKGDATLEQIYAGEQVVIRMPQDALRLTSVVLADSLAPVEGDQSRAPFRHFGFDVVPNTTRTFRAGGTATLLFAVLGATADAEQNLDLKVSYSMFYNDPKRGWYNPFNKPIGVRLHQAQAVQAQAFPIQKWPAGKYKFVVEVVDNKSGGQVSMEVPFEIKPAA